MLKKYQLVICALLLCNEAINIQAGGKKRRNTTPSAEHLLSCRRRTTEKPTISVKLSIQHLEWEEALRRDQALKAREEESAKRRAAKKAKKAEAKAAKELSDLQMLEKMAAATIQNKKTAFDKRGKKSQTSSSRKK